MYFFSFRTAPENVTVYSINRGLYVHWENINSSEIHQYRVLVTAVYYTSNNATCNETVVSGLDHSLVCENVNIFINYSVTVRAEGNIVGAYSEPVYFMIEAEGKSNALTQCCLILACSVLMNKKISRQGIGLSPILQCPSFLFL